MYVCIVWIIFLAFAHFMTVEINNIPINSSIVTSSFSTRCFVVDQSTILKAANRLSEIVGSGCRYANAFRNNLDTLGDIISYLLIDSPPCHDRAECESECT